MEGLCPRALRHRGPASRARLSPCYIIRYTIIFITSNIFRDSGASEKWEGLRPVHLLRVFLLIVLESNFPGDFQYNYMDMVAPTP